MTSSAAIPDGWAAARPASSRRRCAARTPTPSGPMMAEVDAVIEAGDSIGGSFVVVVEGMPIGLGSSSEWDTRLDGRWPARRWRSRRQGRRDRPRLRHGRPARQYRARRGRCGLAGWVAPDEPRRRHRGRHEQRRADRGPRGAEAGVDAAQAAAEPRPRDRRARPRAHRAVATSPSCRAPRSWARRWSPWSSPTSCSPRSAATRWATCGPPCAAPPDPRADASA